MTVIAFCQREADLARLAIHRLPDGRLVARPRLPSDAITPSDRPGAFNDLWVHVKSGGRYVRHDEVLDEELGVPSYEYASWTDGRPWLRPISEWEERGSDGRPRFERFA